MSPKPSNKKQGFKFYNTRIGYELTILYLIGTVIILDNYGSKISEVSEETCKDTKRTTKFPCKANTLYEYYCNRLQDVLNSSDDKFIGEVEIKEDMSYEK